MSTGRRQAWILLFSLIAFLAAGCGGETPETNGTVAHKAEENGENHTNVEQPATASDRPQHTPGTRNGGETAGTEPHTGAGTDTTGDAENAGGEKKTGRDRSAQDGEKNLEISASDEPRQQDAESSDPANDNPPQPDEVRHTLYGIAIGDSQDAVTNKFGQPASSLVMEDGEETLTVFRYNAFSVGFNSRHEVQFIEVTAELPDPGLGGIRLGSSSSDAIRLLGEPDINTEYVLSYASGGAVLKMDVDPQLQKITAIRLFVAE